MFFVWGIYYAFYSGILRTLADAGHYRNYMLVLGVLAVIVVSYLLGSVNFALVISKLFYHDDIRTHGSGNAGTTNMLRTYGKGAAAATFIGDGVKGVVAVLFACAVFGGTFWCPAASYLAALFAVLGHIFPCFSGFKGGKGFATSFISILALNPVLFLILCFVFFPLVLGTHFVSLGSVTTMWFYSVFLFSFSKTFNPYGDYGVPVLCAIALAAVVTFSHRTNIKRLLAHTESKTYFFKKKPPKTADASGQGDGNQSKTIDDVPPAPNGNESGKADR